MDNMITYYIILFIVAIPLGIISIVHSVKAQKRKRRTAERTNELLEQAAKTDGGSSDIPSQIQKLAELHRSGAITDAEFKTMKARLMKML